MASTATTTSSTGISSGFLAAMGATVGSVLGAFGGGQLVKAYMKRSPAQTRENATILAVGGSAIIGALIGGVFAAKAATAAAQGTCPPCIQAPCPPCPPAPPPMNTNLT